MQSGHCAALGRVIEAVEICNAHRTSQSRMLRLLTLQETLLNLLLRNYLAYNLYDQAEKLRSKTKRPESHSNQQVHGTFIPPSVGAGCRQAHLK